MKQDTTMHTSISAQNRLEITLRFLATGETYRSLMYATRVHETISKFVPVCSAIIKNLRKDYLSTPCTAQERENIATEYWNMWQFPNCLGALLMADTSNLDRHDQIAHFILITKVITVLFLALVDAKYKFTYVNVIVE